MVAVSVDARRRHEAVERFEGREAKLAAAVQIGLGEPIDQAKE